MANGPPPVPPNGLTTGPHLVLLKPEFRLLRAVEALQQEIIRVTRHQTHRGLAPQDERLFAARQLPALRAAAADLCWLLDHGYAARSALELVGNLALIITGRIPRARLLDLSPAETQPDGF